jgi:hypothetical protein
MQGSFGRRLGFGLLLLASACGGSAGGGAQAPSQTAAASQRLEGSWRLLSFEPALAMEEPFKGLLDAQLKTLTVRFSAGQYSAQGPGVDTAGRFEVTTANGDSLAGRVYDRAGAGYDVSGTFVGNQLQFISQGQTFAGRGTLERTK